MAKKKTNANVKAMQRNKIKQRRTLAFVRMLRYGVNNFSRNAWLTVAATAVMSVTLLIIFVTVAAQRILVNTTETITQKANISIYLKGSVSEKTVNELTDKIKKLDNVTGVTYISAEQARHEQAQRYKDNVEALEAIREASNELPATLQVSVKPILPTKTSVDSRHLLVIAARPLKQLVVGCVWRALVGRLRRWCLC